MPAVYYMDPNATEAWPGPPHHTSEPPGLAGITDSKNIAYIAAGAIIGYMYKGKNKMTGALIGGVLGMVIGNQFASKPKIIKEGLQA